MDLSAAPGETTGLRGTPNSRAYDCVGRRHGLVDSRQKNDDPTRIVVLSEQRERRISLEKIYPPRQTESTDAPISNALAVIFRLNGSRTRAMRTRSIRKRCHPERAGCERGAPFASRTFLRGICFSHPPLESALAGIRS